MIFVLFATVRFQPRIFKRILGGGVKCISGLVGTVMSQPEKNMINFGLVANVMIQLQKHVFRETMVHPIAIKIGKLTNSSKPANDPWFWPMKII